VIRVQGEGSRIGIRSPDGRTAAAKQVTLPAAIESTAAGWLVIESAGTKSAGTFQFPPGPLELTSSAGKRGIRFGDGIAGDIAWPSGIRLVPRTDEGVGAVDLIVELPLEEYLPGVLAKELFNNWSLETHIAQAVAARSFALCEIAQAANRPFDVVAGESSQAWIGHTAHATSVEAVRRTRGAVLTYGGRVVPAYYSSCCGGQPANATDAISDIAFNDIPPLAVTAASIRDCCRSAPTFRWKMSLPTAETARRIALWARTERPAMARIDGIAQIETASRNLAGRPVTFVVTDSKGQRFEIPSERLRWAFNADVPGLPDVKTRVKSGDLGLRVSPVAVAVDGRGHGHGVGLCQYGAEALSKRGRTWRDLLSFYYPGAAVTQSYASAPSRA
jgi:stage II sporulation protein D